MILVVDGGFWTFGNITSLKSGMIVSLRSLLSRLIITFLHLHKHTISFRNISSFVFGKFFHSYFSLVNHWLGKTARTDWNFIANSDFTTEMILLLTTFPSIIIQSQRYQRHTYFVQVSLKNTHFYMFFCNPFNGDIYTNNYKWVWRNLLLPITALPCRPFCQRPE